MGGVGVGVGRTNGWAFFFMRSKKIQENNKHTIETLQGRHQKEEKKNTN
jgi:hypothetical protein